jgi:hypothetical protein
MRRRTRYRELFREGLGEEMPVPSTVVTDVRANSASTATSMCPKAFLRAAMAA